jgi:protocatechuate 3,4-dioxygenase beta subunit
MKRKIIFSLLLVINLVMLGACSSAAATTTTSDNPTNSSLSASSSNNDTNGTSTLACSGGSTSATVTPALTEGPYYKAGSPEQSDLYQNDMVGTKLVITGYVYDTNCQPLADAWLDFWQADANGHYDNSGYTLRGHQYTDENGRFQLTTVVPGLYPGRTEHIHVKVQAPNGQVITSQLFFPGVSQNDSDGIYNSNLLLSIQETSDGLQGQYDFVVPGS